MSSELGEEAASETSFSVVLDVRGGSFDATTYVAAHGLRPVAIWANGDRRLRGEAETTSGFRIRIGEGDSWADAWRQAAHSLGHLAAALRRLPEGVDLECDVGCFFGPASAATFVQLEPKAVSLLASLNIGFLVSVCRSSD